MKKLRLFSAQPKMAYEKVANMISWFTTESGTVSVWLPQGDDEEYKLTDINGRLLEQGALKNGRVMFIRLLPGSYTLHVITSNGVITKEIDIQ